MLESLDAIIATLAVVLALSLIVQAIQQIIKQWLDLKSNYMRFQLFALFGSPSPESDSGWLPGLQPITRLSRDVDDRAKNIVSELEAAVKSFGYRDMELLERMNVDEMKRIIESLPMFAKARDELKRALKDVDTWFDITKRAFQDLYERKMKVWSFFIGAVVVLLLNANLLDIYREFSVSKVLRDAAVTWAERVVSMPRDSVVYIRQSGSNDATTEVKKTDEQIQQKIRQRLADIESVVSARTFQILRWRQGQREALFSQWFSVQWWKNWGKSVLGWLGMTLLVSFGAPFWYDFLKTIVGIKEKLRK